MVAQGFSNTGLSFRCHIWAGITITIKKFNQYKWINFFDFRWKLGIDGLSIGPVLLTGFITTLATLAAWPVTRDSRLFHFLMLAMYSGQIGLFASRIFYFFFSCGS